MNILIADDDLASRMFLEHQLKGLGRCLAVDNGLDAVRAFEGSLDRGQPFDLVILDILMPFLSGQEAARRIRELEDRRGTTPAGRARLIMISALSDWEGHDGALSADSATRFLTKPFRSEDILEAVRGLGREKDP
ncbi:MAG: response regulator [Desulfovibrionaceae bacterium]|nr:response regulator [Desulfovibrionaceae bacterium]